MRFGWHEQHIMPHRSPLEIYEPHVRQGRLSDCTSWHPNFTSAKSNSTCVIKSRNQSLA